MGSCIADDARANVFWNRTWGTPWQTFFLNNTRAPFDCGSDYGVTTTPALILHVRVLPTAMPATRTEMIQTFAAECNGTTALKFWNALIAQSQTFAADRNWMTMLKFWNASFMKSQAFTADHTLMLRSQRRVVTVHKRTANVPTDLLSKGKWDGRLRAVATPTSEGG